MLGPKCYNQFENDFIADYPAIPDMKKETDYFAVSPSDPHKKIQLDMFLKFLIFDKNNEVIIMDNNNEKENQRDKNVLKI